MLTHIFVIALLSVIIGLVLVRFKLVEATVAVTTGSVTFVICTLFILAGWAIFKGDKLSFNEYWNGYEQQAIFQIQPCTRDGGCGYEYDCDPYTVQVPHTTTDSKGNVTTTYTTETRYHDCPYVTEEWYFSIKTTLGDYSIAHNVAENPVEYRAGNGIPNVERGYNPFWVAANNRINAGTPGPVTKRMTYDNYLLASDQSILNQYSDQIDALLKANLLPKVTHDVVNFYYANKVYFVNVAPVDGVAKWETALSYLNAGLGTELQGDLHLVVIAGDVQPDAYITALKAYWTNPAVFGDEAASKNSIIVAIGTDGSTVTWARAITGMPLGNEYMSNQIKNVVVGQPLTADAIIGQVSSEFYKSGEKIKARSVGTTGALYRTIWGLDDPQSRFKRISMSGGGEGDNGSGFGYLKDEIQPSTFQQTAMVLFTLIVTAICWAIALYYVYDTSRRRNDYGYTQYYIR